MQPWLGPTPQRPALLGHLHHSRPAGTRPSSPPAQQARCLLPCHGWLKDSLGLTALAEQLTAFEKRTDHNFERTDRSFKEVRKDLDILKRRSGSVNEALVRLKVVELKGRDFAQGLDATSVRALLEPLARHRDTPAERLSWTDKSLPQVVDHLSQVKV